MSFAHNCKMLKAQKKRFSPRAFSYVGTLFSLILLSASPGEAFGMKRSLSDKEESVSKIARVVPNQNSFDDVDIICTTDPITNFTATPSFFDFKEALMVSEDSSLSYKTIIPSSTAMNAEAMMYWVKLGLNMADQPVRYLVIDEYSSKDFTYGYPTPQSSQPIDILSLFLQGSKKFLKSTKDERYSSYCKALEEIRHYTTEIYQALKDFRQNSRKTQLPFSSFFAPKNAVFFKICAPIKESIEFINLPPNQFFLHLAFYQKLLLKNPSFKYIAIGPVDHKIPPNLTDRKLSKYEHFEPSKYQKNGSMWVINNYHFKTKLNIDPNDLSSTYKAKKDYDGGELTDCNDEELNKRFIRSEVKSKFQKKLYRKTTKELGKR